jgi:RimJ/RimL family protein N-acetyltransferase
MEHLPVERIIGIIHPENEASRRVLEKVGMKLVGPARYFGMDCERYLLERSGLRQEPSGG